MLLSWGHLAGAWLGLDIGVSSADRIVRARSEPGHDPPKVGLGSGRVAARLVNLDLSAARPGCTAAMLLPGSLDRYSLREDTPPGEHPWGSGAERLQPR